MSFVPIMPCALARGGSMDNLTIGNRVIMSSRCINYFYLQEEVNAMEAKLAITSILRQNPDKILGFHYDPNFVIWTGIYMNELGMQCKLLIRLIHKLPDDDNLAIEFEYIEKRENKIPPELFSIIQRVIGQEFSYVTYM